MSSQGFKYRGVVEGFYGKPWTHSQRLRGITYFADFGFNTYLIAPKDDMFQRARWRELLPSDRARELEELVQAGVARQLSVSMTVSPGLSVKYSSMVDREAVLQRFRQQLDMGAMTFALLWDDIDWDLLHPEDVERYSFIEDAQAEFSNWVYERLIQLNPDVVFMVCPMIYNGRGPNAYIKQLGSALNPAIELMWTGREIRSNYLDSVDADVFALDAGRAPVYWDNFPVNNLSMRFELHMGPVVGRAADLDQHARGLLANPMNQFACSLLPLATVANYLNSPATYNADEAWESAFYSLFGNSPSALALRTFFRCVMSSPLSTDAAPDLRKVLGVMATAQRQHDSVAAAEALTAYAREMRSAAAVLRSPDFEFPEIYLEIVPWISKFERGSAGLDAMAQYLQEPSLTHRAAIESIAQQLDADRHLVFGDILDGAIAELLSQ